MPRCLVYLFTYKRNHLLPRAVQSLLNQSFTDWICEVHNDCPEDQFPAQYLSSLNDQRFIIKNHQYNLGAMASFNLAFQRTPIEYVSILEDDNWWEPTFLQEMIVLMDNRPQINVAWSNMNLWQEHPGNDWKNTGSTIWPKSLEISIFKWPQDKQAMSALHSNGSMIFRGVYAHNYLVPEKGLFNAVELIRERSFEHPVLLNHKPLANFAITISTNRSDDPYAWMASQIMMLASFVKTSPTPQTTFINSLIYHRSQRPNPVINFFLANLLFIKNNLLYKHFNFYDWLAVIKWLIVNMGKLSRIKRHLDNQTETYDFLLQETRLRYQENSSVTS